MPNKERIHYYDIAKGLLMIMVVFGHMLGHNVPASEKIWRVFSVEPYYMPAFFIITGLLTNFSCDNFFQFLYKKFKTIIIPTVTFLFFQHWLIAFFSQSEPLWFGVPLEIILRGEFPWFISSLFFALIINFSFIKFLSNKWHVFLASIILYIIGVTLHTTGLVIDRNGVIYCINHILTMNVFLTTGYLLRGVTLKYKYLFITIPLYKMVIFSTNFIPFGVPYITGGTICLDFLSMIPLLILGTSGSITLLLFCKLINSSDILELIGKNTLGIYILQGGLISPLFAILLDSQTTCSEFQRTVIFFLSLTLVILISIIISHILHSKYLAWSMGKF